MRKEPIPGDLARLRSGGPRMTVEDVVGAPSMRYAHCAWFDDRQAPKAANFRIEALMPAAQEDAEPGRPPPG